MLLQQQQQRRLWDATKAPTTTGSPAATTTTTSTEQTAAEGSNKLDLDAAAAAAKRRGVRLIQRKDHEDTRHACRKQYSNLYLNYHSYKIVTVLPYSRTKQSLSKSLCCQLLL